MNVRKLSVNKACIFLAVLLLAAMVTVSVVLLADISGGTWGVARNFCIFLTKDRALLT